MASAAVTVVNRSDEMIPENMNMDVVLTDGMPSETGPTDYSKETDIDMIKTFFEYEMAKKGIAHVEEISELVNLLLAAHEEPAKLEGVVGDIIEETLCNVGKFLIELHGNLVLLSLSYMKLMSKVTERGCQFFIAKSDEVIAMPIKPIYGFIPMSNYQPVMVLDTNRTDGPISWTRCGHMYSLLSCMNDRISKIYELGCQLTKFCGFEYVLSEAEQARTEARAKLDAAQAQMEDGVKKAMATKDARIVKSETEPSMGLPELASIMQLSLMMRNLYSVHKSADKPMPYAMPFAHTDLLKRLKNTLQKIDLSRLLKELMADATEDGTDLDGLLGSEEFHQRLSNVRAMYAELKPGYTKEHIVHLSLNGGESLEVSTKYEENYTSLVELCREIVPDFNWNADLIKAGFWH